MEEKTNRSKKICFALLVHNKRSVVLDLLDNIRGYCPNSSVILYNGGNDSSLCDHLGVPVCPTSRKLYYGITGIYLLETMRWLEDMNYDYDYLINMDSDALFVREGYESFITQQMNDKDYMGVDTKLSHEDSFIGNQVREEYDLWKPLFGEKPLYESFNVGQVFSRRLVRRFLKSKQYDELKTRLKKTGAFGIDEVAYVTMTERYGFELNAYPASTGSSIRYRPYFALDETIGLLNGNEKGYLLHPVPRDMKDETRVFVQNNLKQLIQSNAEAQERFLDTYLGDMPFFIRRQKSTGNTVEWLTASLGQGISYWKSVKSRGKINMYGPHTFGSERVEAFTALETRIGNIEMICRIGKELIHYWRDEDSSEWFESPAFAEGVRGTPAFIESSYGNFEVVAPLKDGGLGHWWRNNDQGLTWSGPDTFGNDVYEEVMLIENNLKQLTVVVKTDDEYRFFVRDDGHSWEWLGPY
ncbi:hypothetical protein PaeBR_09295 [Paenibacillus sp. BR2-3]|uniref:hypothetical protein n=1 Tax=Paenibacillus sp. BR2-3 TaxID=3048494 RepID=UPI003977774D